MEQMAAGTLGASVNGAVQGVLDKSEMTKAQQQFIDRIDKLEQRFKGDKYATSFLMPRELLIELRDEMVQPPLNLFDDAANADAIDELAEQGIEI